MVAYKNVYDIKLMYHRSGFMYQYSTVTCVAKFRMCNISQDYPPTIVNATAGLQVLSTFPILSGPQQQEEGLEDIERHLFCIAVSSLLR